jgi:hypothetical protein
MHVSPPPPHVVVRWETDEAHSCVSPPPPPPPPPPQRPPVNSQLLLSRFFLCCCLFLCLCFVCFPTRRRWRRRRRRRSTLSPPSSEPTKSVSPPEESRPAATTAPPVVASNVVEAATSRSRLRNETPRSTKRPRCPRRRLRTRRFHLLPRLRWQSAARVWWFRRPGALRVVGRGAVCKRCDAEEGRAGITMQSSQDGSVYAVSAATGALRWQYKTSDIGTGGCVLLPDASTLNVTSHNDFRAEYSTRPCVPVREPSYR